MTEHPSYSRRLTVTEAVEYSGLSVSTLLRWEKRGRISPDRTPGGHRRYRIAQLDALSRPEGGVARNSGQHPVSSAPSGDADSRERLDRPATFSTNPTGGAR